MNGNPPVNPFYERLDVLGRCRGDIVGDIPPSRQKCIHLVAVLLLAVAQCCLEHLRNKRYLQSGKELKIHHMAIIQRRRRRDWTPRDADVTRYASLNIKGTDIVFSVFHSYIHVYSYLQQHYTESFNSIIRSWSFHPIKGTRAFHRIIVYYYT